jgi:hypothetical protein
MCKFAVRDSSSKRRANWTQPDSDRPKSPVPFLIGEYRAVKIKGCNTN